jgi:hypothetical protein
MALKYLACFEDNNLLEITALGSAAVVATSPRTGNYCLHVPTNLTAFQHGWQIQVGESEFYFQFAVRKSSHTPYYNNYRIFDWRDSSGNVLGCFYYIKADASFDVYVGDYETKVGNSGGISTSDKVMEGYIKIADSGGRIVIRVDGQTMVDYTGDTYPSGAASTTVNNIRHSNLRSNAQADLYFDDIAVCDAIGSDLLWPNGIRFWKYDPNAVGNYSQWTPTAGNNYENVDETPPSMSDKVASTTTGHKDSYGFTNLDSAIKSIKCLVMRYWGEGGGSIKRLFRISSADYLSSALTVPGTFNFVQDITYVSPATSNPWGISEVNGMEAGMENQ